MLHSDKKPLASVRGERFAVKKERDEEKALVWSQEIRFYWILCFVFFLGAPLSGWGDQEVRLNPLVKEGSAAEVLFEDSIVPVQRGKLEPNAGSGSVQGWMRDQNAIPMSDAGRPGNLAQVRGFGVSSEDADVQALGLSLNLPQGGGFDLSSFPQYLWDSYQFQIGPSLNLLSPVSSAGTLRLVPWTETALREGEDRFRLTEFVSTQGVNQISFAAKRGSVAAVAGWSDFKVKGPSGILSVQHHLNSRVRARVHFLGTDLDYESLGPLSMSGYASPWARNRTIRGMPVLQSEVVLGQRESLRSTFFIDYNRIEERDPSLAYASSHSTRQWGFEHAYLVKDWKLGGGYRSVVFEGGGQSRQTQGNANLQVSRWFSSGSSFSFEPTLQGVWVSGLGFQPQGTLGVRKEWGLGEKAIFSRISFSRKYPTMIDRYFQYGSFYVGNPSLKPEKIWTALSGVEWKHRRSEVSLQFYAQQRQDVRVFQDHSVTNLGNSYVLGILGSGQWPILKTTSLFHSMTLSRSEILRTRGSFPYVPSYLSVSGVRYRFETPQFLGEFYGAARVSSAVGISGEAAGAKLPGYCVWDVGAQMTLLRRFTLGVRLEDILDRVYEVVKGYPIGRSFSVSFSGYF